MVHLAVAMMAPHLCHIEVRRPGARFAEPLRPPLQKETSGRKLSVLLSHLNWASDDTMLPVDAPNRVMLGLLVKIFVFSYATICARFWVGAFSG